MFTEKGEITLLAIISYVKLWIFETVIQLSEFSTVINRKIDV